jgi:hypothetical protein
MREFSILYSTEKTLPIAPQSNDRGSSHRRKSAAWHIFYVVFAISLAYPSGEKGDILLVQMIYTFHSRRLEEGREGSAPCA